MFLGSGEAPSMGRTTVGMETSFVASEVMTG